MGWAELPFIPHFQLSTLFEKGEQRRRNRRSESVEPLSRVRDMLFGCPSLDNTGIGLHYDTWRNVMFAVHREYYGSDYEDDAYDLLLEWSEQWGRHDQAWFDHVWSTAKSDHERAISLGSIIRDTAREMTELTRDRIEMEDERDPEEIRDPEGYRERKKAEKAETEWKDHIVSSMDGSGTPLAIPENLVAFLTHYPVLRDNLGFCQFENTIAWQVSSWVKPPEGLENVPTHDGRLQRLSSPYDMDAHHLVIQALLRKNFMPKFSKSDINDAVKLIAPQRPFNPLVDMFEEVEWDGVDRASKFFQRCFGAEDTPLNREAGLAFWKCSAMRVLHPGAQWDYVFVLVSARQGLGKSKTLEICASWRGHSLFSDAPFDMSDAKRTGEALAGRLITEIGEGVALSKYNVQDLKACITRTVDRFRPAYGRQTVSIPRIGQMVITQNHDRLPPDDTGNRRYIIIFCGEAGADFMPGMVPDFEWSWDDLFENLAQLRAEGLVYARREIDRAKKRGLTPGVSFPKEVMPALEDLQKEKTPQTRVDIWAEEVRAFFEEPVPADTVFLTGRVPQKYHGKMVLRRRVTMREFFYDHLKRPIGEDYIRFVNDLSAAFRRYGKAESRQLRHQGQRTNVWVVKGWEEPFEIVGEEADFSPDAEESNVVDLKAARRRNRERGPVV